MSYWLSKVGGFGIGLEEIFPESAVEEFGGIIVFDDIVNFVMGKPVGDESFQSIARIPQSESQPEGDNDSMSSPILSPPLQHRVNEDIVADISLRDKQAREEEGYQQSCICPVPIADHLCEWWLVDDDGKGLLVDAGPPSQNVVIPIEFEAVNPPKQIIVRSPGHPK